MELTEDQLDRWGASHKPPQSWYESPEGNPFEDDVMTHEELPPGTKLDTSDSTYSLFRTGTGVMANGVVHCSAATAFRFYMGDDISVLDLSKFELDLTRIPMLTCWSEK